MSTFDPNFPPFPPDANATPSPTPDFGPAGPAFSIPTQIPPDGPVIQAPPVEIFPQPLGSEPPDGPDEGGEERDFPLVPEVPVPPGLEEIEGGNPGVGQVFAAADGDAAEGVAADSSELGDSSGSISAGDAGAGDAGGDGGGGGDEGGGGDGD